MKVSVVVINWNGAEKLKKFLPEILKVNCVDEFIVTDDASNDSSIEVLENNFPTVKVVKREENGGFSANTNTGVKAAMGDLVFLLNPDAVPEKNCVKNALPYFKDQKVFSLGCNTGGNWSWAKWEKGFFWHYMNQGGSETHPTLWARGGSGIFRKDVFEKLGGMDELFNPYYEEDTDLGYRAIKQGFVNLWVKECKVQLPAEKGVIEANIEKKKFSKIAQRNQLLFIWKNITDNHLISDHLWHLAQNLMTHPKYWTVFLAALFKLPSILVKRRHEKAAIQISDSQILAKYSPV